MIKPIDELIEDRVRAIERDFKELRGVSIVLTYGYKIEKNQSDFYITPQEIIDCVAYMCNVPVELIQGIKKGKTEVCDARHIAVVEIIKFHPKLTLKEVGSFFAGRDHATIIHSRNIYNDLFDTNREFRETAQRVCAWIAKEIEAKKY